ncbi:MAG: hypothetical protein V1856_03080 [Candidatus Liptonbacteria bacterium]
MDKQRKVVDQYWLSFEKVPKFFAPVWGQVKDLGFATSPLRDQIACVVGSLHSGALGVLLRTKRQGEASELMYKVEELEDWIKDLLEPGEVLMLTPISRPERGLLFWGRAWRRCPHCQHIALRRGW